MNSKKRIKITAMAIAFIFVLSAGIAYILWAWRKHELCKCDIVVVGIISLFAAAALIVSILREFGSIKE